MQGAMNFGRIVSIIGTSVKQGKSAYSTISGIFTGTVTSLFKNLHTTEQLQNMHESNNKRRYVVWCLIF